MNASALTSPDAVVLQPVRFRVLSKTRIPGGPSSAFSSQQPKKQVLLSQDLSQWHNALPVLSPDSFRLESASASVGTGGCALFISIPLSLIERVSNVEDFSLVEVHTELGCVELKPSSSSIGSPGSSPTQPPPPAGSAVLSTFVRVLTTKKRFFDERRFGDDRTHLMSPDERRREAARRRGSVTKEEESIFARHQQQQGITPPPRVMTVPHEQLAVALKHEAERRQQHRQKMSLLLSANAITSPSSAASGGHSLLVSSNTSPTANRGTARDVPWFQRTLASSPSSASQNPQTAAAIMGKEATHNISSSGNTTGNIRKYDGLVDSARQHNTRESRQRRNSSSFLSRTKGEQEDPLRRSSVSSAAGTIVYADDTSRSQSRGSTSASSTSAAAALLVDGYQETAVLSSRATNGSNGIRMTDYESFLLQSLQKAQLAEYVIEKERQN